MDVSIESLRVKESGTAYLLPFATTSHAFFIFIILVILVIVFVIVFLFVTILLLLFFLPSPWLAVLPATVMTSPSLFLFFYGTRERGAFESFFLEVRHGKMGSSEQRSSQAKDRVTESEIT
jgi:hypothetical protein